jgi:curved DNA-binding protein CbpA
MLLAKLNVRASTHLIDWARFFSTNSFQDLYDDTNPKKHYNNLEINPGPTATRKRIKEQYQKLAMKWHPDRNSSSEAKEKFTEITQSYQILLNAESKREYDQWIYNRESNHSSNSTTSPVWSKSYRKATNFSDRKADDYAFVRRNTMGTSSREGPATKRKNVFQNGAIHSFGGDSRLQDRLEYEKVSFRQHHVKEDRYKFLFITSLVVVLLYIKSKIVQNHGTNDYK